MSKHLSSQIANWLNAQQIEGEGLYKTSFAEHHLGNTFIRSLHGGVSASFMEICAQAETAKNISEDKEILVASSSTDYLRITKDADLFARTSIVRISKRLSVVDVTCWQDSEDLPVVRSVITLKIN